MKNSTMMTLPNGTKVWALNSECLDINNFRWDKVILHRENDKPAIEYSNGTKYWYKNGKIHRENDKPAIEWSNGSKFWYNKNGRFIKREDKTPTKMKIKNGTEVWVLNEQELDSNNFDWYKAKIHRENDLPAVICSNGTKQWYKDNKLHRDNDNPAIIFPNGTKYWYNQGKLHRNFDKPATIFPNGTKEWYFDGKLHRRDKKPARITPFDREWWEYGQLQKVKYNDITIIRTKIIFKGMSEKLKELLTKANPKEWGWKVWLSLSLLVGSSVVWAVQTGDWDNVINDVVEAVDDAVEEQDEDTD
ncbi:MAG TPA: hypothetical protein VKN14_06335 [Flavobacteriaceae bacterium]|nr:hypothetical protein [Flavobacteriaceae bacterium]